MIVAQATCQVIDVAERLWLGLSSWYRPNQYITNRFSLRHALTEPEGVGAGGTMLRPMIAYGVLLDVQALIVLTVRMMVGFSSLASKIDLAVR